MNDHRRCIVGARVSVMTGPQKVSQLAQVETGARWVAQNDGEIVGTFEDLGVSASVEPMKRPDLGPWLTDPEKVYEWDTIVFSKMDRAFRSTSHCVDLARWCEEHRKTIVFAEDGLKLDYSSGKSDSVDSMMSELFVYIGSFFAQLELNRFRTRSLDTHRVLRQSTRWGTGRAPLGFRIIDHPSGKGKGLTTNPEEREILHQMGERLIGGESFTAIAAWLRDEYPGVRKWTSRVVIQCLTSPRTQGFKIMVPKPGQSSGDYVLDADGDPIRLAEPTFDADTWAQIQEAAQRRSVTKSRTNSANPMLGVGFCGQCGSSLAQQFTRWKQADGTPRVSKRYHCAAESYCKNSSVDMDTLNTLLEEHVLEEYGDLQVTRRVWQQGNDLAGDLERVETQISRLRGEQDAGLIVSDDDYQAYIDRMRRLVDKRTAIEAAEPVQPGWVLEDTGETFAQAWSRTEDPVERRKMLVDRGVRLDVVSAKPFDIKIYIASTEVDSGGRPVSH